MNRISGLEEYPDDRGTSTGGVSFTDYGLHLVPVLLGNNCCVTRAMFAAVKPGTL